MNSPLWGTHSGLVEAVNDPEQLGRLKVRVPTVYGPGGAKENSLSTDQLPWANATGLPAGGTPESGALQWLPSVGDQVNVRFLDGEPEKPIWEWGSQTRSQSAAFPYWRRQPGGYGANGAPPDATALLRHGHTIELSPQAVLMATKRGYALILTDAKDGAYGLVQLLTQKGYQITIDDNEDKMTIYVPTFALACQMAFLAGTQAVFTFTESLKIVTGDHALEAGRALQTTTEESEITAGTRASLQAPRVNLGNHQASDPVVRLSDLRAVANAIMARFNAHVHIGNLGKPTSPPTAPMQLNPTGSDITHSA